MTTITYRSGVMAADTASYLSGGSARIPGNTRKIHRLPDGSLLGGAGHSLAIQIVTEWVENGMKDKLPAGNEAVSILVRPDGAVFIIDGNYIEEFDGPFFAVGSGAAAALGAMHAGKNAVEAVEIAMLVDPYTGGNVMVERLVVVPAPSIRLASNRIPRGIMGSDGDEMSYRNGCLVEQVEAAYRQPVRGYD